MSDTKAHNPSSPHLEIDGEYVVTLQKLFRRDPLRFWDALVYLEIGYTWPCGSCGADCTVWPVGNHGLCPNCSATGLEIEAKPILPVHLL